MLTTEQAARAVGLSDRQLRRRIEATKPLLAPFLRRGEKNRVLLDPGAIEILRAVEDRRASGATLEDATAFVADSLRGEQGGKQEQTSGKTPGNDSDAWRMLLAEKDHRIAELRDRILFLEARIEKLEPLALPRPRRWVSLFRR